MATAMARLASTAPLARVEINDVASLLDSYNRALTLGNAAIQATTSHTAKVGGKVQKSAALPLVAP